MEVGEGGNRWVEGERVHVGRESVGRSGGETGGGEETAPVGVGEGEKEEREGSDELVVLVAPVACPSPPRHGFSLCPHDAPDRALATVFSLHCGPCLLLIKRPRTRPGGCCSRTPGANPHESSTVETVYMTCSLGVSSVLFSFGFHHLFENQISIYLVSILTLLSQFPCSSAHR